MANNKNMSYTVTEVIGMYWEQNLETIQTFWFVRLDEGEMRKNVVWKWRNCRWEVEEGDGDSCHSTGSTNTHSAVDIRFSPSLTHMLVLCRHG